MKLYVTLSDEDYIKFNEFCLMNSNAGKRSLWSMRLILPVFALVAIVSMAIAGAERGLLIVECAVMVILSAIWQTQAKKIMIRSVRKSVENTKKDGKLPYNPNAEVEFTENEIIETSENSVQRANYDEVRLVGDAAEYIFILIGAVQGVIIPKSCAEGQAEELMDFLKRKIPDKVMNA